jgi:ABC exporter DevB family membrane fusion protein
MRWAVAAGSVVLMVVVGVGVYAQWTRRTTAGAVQAVVGSISDSVVATGRVVPVTEVAVANKIPGRIKRILVVEGAEVRTGQPIIEFDNHEYATQVQQAEARLATTQADVQLSQRTVEAAKARWIEAKSGARPQEIARARADVEQAQERMKNAEVERTRLKKLLDDGLVARSQYDTADTEAQVSRARFRSAEQMLSLVIAGPKPETIAAMWAQVREAEAALRRAESQVVQARADVDYARAVLKTTVLESTVNGKVTRKLVEPGEAVDIGMPLLIVADVGRTLVKAEVDETDAGKLAVGQPAEVTSDAYPGRIFRGTVIEIGQAIGKRKIRPEDPAKIQDMKVLETKIEIGEGGNDLKLGMTVDARIITARKSGVVMVPRTAIPSGIKEAMVQVIGSGGQERRRVAFGVSDRNNVEISHGIRAGERFIIDPAGR